MKRKDYQRTTMKVVQFKQKCQLLAGSGYVTTGTGGTSLTGMGDAVDL